MVGKKRNLVVLVILIMVIAVAGGAFIFLYYSREMTPAVRFHAFENFNADNKTNTLTNTLMEFSSSDYEKVQTNDTEYMSMRGDLDDWNGMHFIFDLSGYNLSALASIRFTWIGRIIGPEYCDCMELWYYRDSGWVKFDDINQSIWMTKTDTWTGNLADYLDNNGKVDFSVVTHVRSGGPLDTLTAYILTQFADFEISYKS